MTYAKRAKISWENSGSGRIQGAVHPPLEVSAMKAPPKSGSALRLLAFVGLGLVLAVVGTALWLQQKHRRQVRAVEAAQAQAEQQQRAALEAAERKLVEAELERYRARYLGNRTGHYAVGVLIVDEHGRPNPRLGSALAALLTTNGVPASASFFNAALVSDGLFEQVFRGASPILEKLEAAKYADTLLLGRQTVRYTTNRALENLVTAQMTLAFHTQPLTGHAREHAEVLEAVGAELARPELARNQAEERLVKQMHGLTGLLQSLQPQPTTTAP